MWGFVAEDKVKRSASGEGRPDTAATVTRRPLGPHPPSHPTQLGAYRILELSEKRYKEEPLPKNPILKPWGTGWANTAMHHISVLKLAEDDYLAVFDGEHCG